MESPEPLIHWFDRIPSTQDAAHQLAAEGAPAGTTVVAVEQTAGRGSRGQRWHSARGGLWLSIICRPEASPAPAVLSLRAALAVAVALETSGVPGVQIKWPNDLMLGGRKVGGILCEARWTGDALGWVVVGVGVNVRNPIAPELMTTAAALGPLVPDMREGALAMPVARALAAIAPHAGRLDHGELAAFAERDWLRGRQLAEPVIGTVDGVSSDGALRVRSAEAVQLVRAGPIVPAGASTLHA